METYLIVGVICGIISALIASNKGRNAFGWFFGGFFLGIIGIVIVAVISNPKQERAQRDLDDVEYQRMRERLAQEKIKTETFRKHAAGRLDAHDGALGMDTRAIAGPNDSPALLSNGKPETLPPPNPSRARWFYDLEGKTLGPVSELEIKEQILANTIDANTLLWAEDMSEWTPLGKIGVFSK